MMIKSVFNQLGQLKIWLIALSSLLLITPTATAQRSSAPIPSLVPLETELLDPNTALPPNVVTANTISQQYITIPSLWWAEEQFDKFGGKLLVNWLAYQEEQRVDLVVSRQPWTLLNYLERYSFINHFGTVARDYNYNVRVFNDRAEPLATYTCDYTTLTLPSCEVLMFEGLGPTGLPVERIP
ncbi:hypothetical protein [Coleofasciculus sp. G2-EDA-02]|uniref:hypothetical protein n=1 Tax=Coleofasciculus sp. G2-EDA-02 TaxID=3069529 RepID=UPI0032F238D0